MSGGWAEPKAGAWSLELSEPGPSLMWVAEPSSSAFPKAISREVA